MIVLAIVVVLATAGALDYANSYRRSTLTDTMHVVVSMLRLAQQKAIAQEQGAAWGVFFDNTADADPYADIYSGDAYAGGTVVEHYQLPKMLSLTAPVSGSSNDVHFAKFSGVPATSSAIIIKLRGSAQTKTITISEAGGISND